MNISDVLKKMGWLIKLVSPVLILMMVGCGGEQTVMLEPTPPGGTVYQPKTQGFSVEQQLLPILNGGHPNAIPGEYIVTFGARTQSASKEEMAIAHSGEARNIARTNVLNKGGEIKQEYTSFAGFSAKLDDAALRELRSNPNVVSIEANVTVALEVDFGSNESNEDSGQGTLLSWGVDRLDGTMDSVYTSANNGENVNVYVLDSGIDTAHDVFGGRAINAYDNVEDGNESCGHHGTGVASIIGGNGGVADGVILHSVRILNCSLIGDIADTIEAIEWIAENAVAPAVVNVSVATYGSTVYNQVVEKLVAQGIMVVTAAGNDNRFDACDVSPAGANGVLTAGAIDDNDKLAWFNSKADRGCLDVYAPGVDVGMAYDGNTYGTSSGTSFAAPHVTGCAARYLQSDPIATPADVIAAVQASAVDGILTCDFGVPIELAEIGLIELDINNDVPTAVGMNNINVNTHGVTLAIVATMLLMVTSWAKSHHLQPLNVKK